MQADGNLVVYTVSSFPLWASHTSGYPNATLAIQNDGNMAIYWSGVAIWATNTC
jgi:hypothetical protein